MTCEIYCLRFAGTDKVYIGQSKNIENRFKEHLYTMDINKASIKLQEAYYTYGKPNLEIVLENIDITELDKLEIEAIDIFDSKNNGFNSTTGGTVSCGGLAGLEASNIKYNKDQLVLCFTLLAEPIPHKDISEQCNISIYTVRDIATGRSHKWLRDSYPDVYQKILKSNIQRQSIRSSAAGRGTIYPLLKAPDGTVHKVDNLTRFAQQHKSCRHYLGKVLNGSREEYKGWTVYNG